MALVNNLSGFGCWLIYRDHFVILFRRERGRTDQYLNKSLPQVSEKPPRRELWGVFCFLFAPQWKANLWEGGAKSRSNILGRRVTIAHQCLVLYARREFRFKNHVKLGSATCVHKDLSCRLFDRSMNNFISHGPSLRIIVPGPQDKLNKPPPGKTHPRHISWPRHENWI